MPCHIEIEGEENTLCRSPQPQDKIMKVSVREASHSLRLSPFGEQIPEADRCPECVRLWQRGLPTPFRTT